MRYFAPIVAFAGILVLLLFLRFDAQSVDSLDDVADSTLVRMVGTVSSVRSWDDRYRFFTENFSFVCACSTGLLHKQVVVKGTVERFSDITYLKVLEINVLD